MKPILKPILSNSDVPTIDHQLESRPNLTPLTKSEEKSPNFAVNFAVNLLEKDQGLKCENRRGLNPEPLVRVTVPDSDKTKSSIMHESFSSIFDEKLIKFGGKAGKMNQPIPGKTPQGKKPDLRIETPGKRKCKENAVNSSSKKTRLGVADCTRNQPDVKTSFGDLLLKFGGK